MMIKKHEGIARYIKNWADNTNIQVRSSHLTLCCLTDNRSEMPNFSYTKTLKNKISNSVLLFLLKR